jgi:outer membrane protein TolC
MRLAAFIATFLIITIPLHADDNDGPLTVTLSDAVRIALERHPDVEKARQSGEILKGKVREVRSQALPEVNIVSNALRMRDPSLLNASGIENFPPELRQALVPHGVTLFDYAAQVKQPLYTAGKVGTALKLAAVQLEGATSEIDRAQQDLSLEVVRAFYALMWAQKYSRVVDDEQKQKSEHAAMARTRFQNGVATEVDVLRSEVAVANGQPDVVRARNAIRLTQARLNYLLFRPIDAPITLAGDFEEKSFDDSTFDELAAEAVRRRPEMHLARIQERSSQVQVDLAKAESRMRVDFAAGYGVASRMAQNLTDLQYARWNMAVAFTLPVFDGFRRSGLVYQATAAGHQAKLEREKTEQQVRLDLQQGLNELNAAKETLRAAEATVGQAEKVLGMMQNNYKWGAATTLDILDAQTALSSARSNVLRGLHDYCVARARLRYVLGRTPWE